MPCWPVRRQHVILAGEAHGSRAIAHIDRVVGTFQQVFADFGWNPLPQHDAVAFAVLQPFDAELRILDRDGGASLPAGDCDEA